MRKVQVNGNNFEVTNNLTVNGLTNLQTLFKSISIALVHTLDKVVQVLTIDLAFPVAIDGGGHSGAFLEDDGVPVLVKHIFLM